MWAHCAVGIAIDTFLFGAPIWVIRSNMMKFNRKTVKVMLVFAVGLLAIITGIVRFIVIHSTNFAENTYGLPHNPMKIAQANFMTVP